MSVENVKAFFERVRTDELLRAQLKAVKSEDARGAIEHLVKLSAKVGLPFTPEQYEESLKAHAGPRRT